MPTYELACQTCGEKFELFVMRMIRADDKICPACGSHDVNTGFGGGVLGSGTSTAVADVASCGTGGFT